MWKKIKSGGLVIGGISLSIFIFILEIIFVWGTGLSMVGYGISLLVKGSILWGLVVLFIGTPIAIGIAQFLFPFWAILFVLAIIWGIIMVLF